MLYIGLALLGTLSVLSYSFDWHKQAYNGVVSKYQDFRRLNQLVATQYEGRMRIFWISSGMVAKMYWIKFLRWANSSIKHIDKKKVAIYYVLNGRLYAIVIKDHRGPPVVDKVLDKDGNDVSSTVLPYLGPNHDFHGQKFTPKFWGYKKLTFHLLMDENKTFYEEDVIVL